MLAFLTADEHTKQRLAKVYPKCFGSQPTAISIAMLEERGREWAARNGRGCSNHVTEETLRAEGVPFFEYSLDDNDAYGPAIDVRKEITGGSIWTGGIIEWKGQKFWVPSEWDEGCLLVPIGAVIDDRNAEKSTEKMAPHVKSEKDLPPPYPLVGEKIREKLHTLTFREREIVKLRYGLEGKVRSVDEVAREMKVREECIRQIEERALRKLPRIVRQAKAEGLFD
ncbi:MAG: sigma factor-like helix-turn-helix DNA-binding protein [Candidatus Pacebacteria bacterium]|nr:sigma factor-like helix-turn-helix DNA-binding protein [Candidatus Paceibacterota bacterium]